MSSDALFQFLQRPDNAAWVEASWLSRLRLHLPDAGEHDVHVQLMGYLVDSLEAVWDEPTAWHLADHLTQIPSAGGDPYLPAAGADDAPSLICALLRGYIADMDDGRIDLTSLSAALQTTLTRLRRRGGLERIWDLSAQSLVIHAFARSEAPALGIEVEEALHPLVTTFVIWQRMLWLSEDRARQAGRTRGAEEQLEYLWRLLASQPIVRQWSELETWLPPRACDLAPVTPTSGLELVPSAPYAPAGRAAIRRALLAPLQTPRTHRVRAARRSLQLHLIAERREAGRRLIAWAVDDPLGRFFGETWISDDGLISTLVPIIDSCPDAERAAAYEQALGAAVVRALNACH